MIVVHYKHLQIECVQGDITRQPDMDAVVNAANAALLPGGGVAGAIHRAAGPRLAEACQPLAPIQPGQAVITPAFNLPNRAVIHCLGPVYGVDSPAEMLLSACYRNALRLAEKEGLTSIAFPAISTGIFGYPFSEAARIAIHTVLDEAEKLSTVQRVRFVLYGQKDYQIYAQLLPEIIRLRDEYARQALFTDLYELTMMQAYQAEGMLDQAVFTLSVGRLPQERNFLLAAGLSTVLDYLENVRFDQAALDYLSSLPLFKPQFIESLRNFRFTGEVYALPEGTPFFANEPILEVVAPLPECQFIETYLMNQIHIQTLLATKAQRVVQAACGRTVVDFGARRIHGVDAAVKGARAFFIGGVNATSNVLAGKEYGIAVSGTMAHSYVQAHETELEAFRAFTQLYPKTYLIADTYGSLKGVQDVIKLAHELGSNFQVAGIRLDSGDLVTLSRQARQMLDDTGLQQVQIFASGGLDEYKIQELLAAGAPIDGFGVGTAMGVSSDVPSLDIAYKLTEYAGHGRVKLSSTRTVLAGRKQVFRQAQGSQDVGDTIARAEEQLPGRPLLVPVMRGGYRLQVAEVSLPQAQAYAREQLARLPQALLALEKAKEPYPVAIFPALREYQQETQRRFTEQEEE